MILTFDERFIYAQTLMCRCKLMRLLGVFQQAGPFSGLSYIESEVLNPPQKRSYEDLEVI